MSTRQGGLRVGLFLALFCLGLTAAGCGGGSSATSASAEPSAQFLEPEGENTIPEFGTEASAAERESASKVVAESLKARGAGEFEAQCETLSSKVATKIVQAEKLTSCPEALKALAEPLLGTQKIRKDTLAGPITAMRVKGDSGYALFHGSDGKNYAVPLEKEGGSWKVGSVITIVL